MEQLLDVLVVEEGKCQMERQEGKCLMERQQKEAQLHTEAVEEVKKRVMGQMVSSQPKTRPDTPIASYGSTMSPDTSVPLREPLYSSR